MCTWKVNLRKAIIMHFCDLNLALTDKVMEQVYFNSKVQLDHCTTIPNILLKDINLSCLPIYMENLFSHLEDHFFFIAGSSNFHHLDVLPLKMKSQKISTSLQLVLFDRHMDNQIFSKDWNELHCGNWISYAYQFGFIKKILIVGSDDYRSLQGFYGEIEAAGDLCYLPKTSQEMPSGFFDPSVPVYISIDTDILSVPSDWGKGRHSLESALNSPVWENLKNYTIAGATILGHVSDRRGFRDLYSHYIKQNLTSVKKFSLKELYEYFVHGIWHKIQTSLFYSPLPLDKQIEIIFSFYDKINALRKV